jgi:hypothetical protein
LVVIESYQMDTIISRDKRQRSPPGLCSLVSSSLKPVLEYPMKTTFCLLGSETFSGLLYTQMPSLLPSLDLTDHIPLKCVDSLLPLRGISGRLRTTTIPPPPNLPYLAYIPGWWENRWQVELQNTNQPFRPPHTQFSSCVYTAGNMQVGMWDTDSGNTYCMLSP